jgi:succinoglycan biosynthesis transport protein ExoP
MNDERHLSQQRVEPGVPSPWLLARDGPAKITDIDLRRFWLTFYKRRWLIFATMLVVVFVTAILERSAPTMYSASAKIRIDPVTPTSGGLTDIASLMVDGSYYQTEYVILGGSALAERVIESLKLYDDPRFTNPPQEVGVVADMRAYVTRAWRALKSRVAWLGLRIPVTREVQQDVAVDAGNRAEAWVATYLSSLTIAPIENSRLVTITYSSTSPELAAAVADEHAKQFIRNSLEAREELNSEAQKMLAKRLEEIRKHSEESEARLNEFRRQHRVLAVGGSEKENIALEQLAVLTTDYAKAQSERIAAESEYTLVKKRRYDELASVQRDPTYNSLKDQLEQLKSEYDRQLQIYKPSYPKTVELAGQISRLQARIGEQIHKSVAGVESQYLAAREKEEALAKAIETQRKAVLDVNDLGVEYQVLYREAEANRELYKNLVTRASEAAIAGTIETSNVRIVEHAALPRSPSLLGVRRNLSRALLLGLLLGIGLAFGLEYLNSAVKNPDDAEALLRLPTLAVVPSFSYESPSRMSDPHSGWRHWLAPPKRVRRRRRRVVEFGRNEPDDPSTAPVIRGNVEPGATPHEIIVVDRPHSVMAEAYRTLRTAVQLSSADNPPRLIQVVSASSREGKTVTGINAAFTLAQSGARVLLVDADLRRPRCHRIVGAVRAPGLVDYLVGHSPLDPCVRQLTLDGRDLHAVPAIDSGDGNGHGNGRRFVVGRVDLLPSGTPAPNPAELLGSARMKETLRYLRDSYDYVIIDSPPVLPVADSVIVGTMVDAVILVIKGQATSKEVVRQAYSKLARLNVHVVGSVLNDVDVTSGDYYYYRAYYASYGGYLEQLQQQA